LPCHYLQIKYVFIIVAVVVVVCQHCLKYVFCQNKAVGDAIGDLLLVAAILMDLLQRHNADADNGMFHSHLFCESTINVVL
jgi:hypothetical protein